VDAIEGSVPIGVELRFHPQVVLDPVFGLRECVHNDGLTVGELLFGFASPLRERISCGEAKGSGKEQPGGVD
jgi:hypothetical protein